MVEDKIIGGEFEINIQQQYLNRKEMAKGAVTYSSGRSALYNILALVKAKKGIKTVLFPDYLCDSVYQMALKNQMNVEFYVLDELLNPGFKDIENKYDSTKAVLLINYFGLKDCKTMVEQLRGIHQDMVILLDNVQAPYEMLNETDADFTFSSFRKAFPVADGSWVLSKHPGLGQPTKVNEFAQYKIAASYLKVIRDQQLFNDEVYLNLYHVGEEKIDDDYLTDMTQLSKSILADMEWHRWAILRKRNAEVIVEGLKKMGICPIVDINEEHVPLFVPVRIENRDKVRKAMFSNNIFLPVHWPVETEYKDRLKRGSDLAEHELSIIVDQRYTVGDMKRILSIIESNI